MKYKPGKWISIQKSWPRRYKYVMVWLSSKPEISPQVDILCLDLKDVNNHLVASWWDRLGLMEYDFGVVTHWMPLPRKPKGVRNVIK